MFEECRLAGDFTLSSGRKSSVFYDFDLLKPMEAAAYVEQLIHQIPDDVFRRVDFVASPALGGIIPGFLVAFAKKKPLVVVDKEGKLRGPDFRAGSYLIVDDVITSFKAAKFVKSSLPGMRCLGVAAYIFRGTYQDLATNAGDIPCFYLARKEQENE
jgi:orotate phosphoribosyltransferase